MQQHPLLQTKLFVPPVRPELVPRPRLIQQLNTGLHRKLTLIAAPAGFGKTTLVSEWVQAMGGATPPIAVAWLSLDENDNDPARFLTYFVAALQTLALSGVEGIESQQESAAQREPVGIIGKGVLSALRSPQPPPLEAVLITLINEIAAISDRIVFVLDDYHLIEAQPIHDALTFLLEHLPPQMHLVIATRDDPHLPLARLRARGQLTELRAADLRFTSSEAAEFLDHVMGLNLSAEDIAALERRTEGWIAGLQLAAISMQGRKDASSLIKSFAGSHRYVLDYLIEEVLERQPDRVQTFLLQTAVLDRLTGSLCDALTGQDSGQATLEMLEHANLFIVPLDEDRRWYRYHHLFADLLRQRLHQAQPEQVSTLHRQAGMWYEDQGLAVEALQHIFAAGDFQWAARLVEQVGRATLWNRSDLTNLLHWLEAFPEEVVRSRPKLCLLSAWALYGSGQPDAIEPFLQSAESRLQVSGDELVARADRLTETSEATSDVLLLSRDVQSMMAEVIAVRALCTRLRGDLPRAIELLRRALELLPSKELHIRAVVTGALASTHYWNGDILAAGSLFPEASAIGWESGNIYMASYSARRLAEVQVMQGYLHQAADTYQQMQLLLARRGEQHATVAGDACVGMGALLCEWNDLDAAVQQLREGIECGKQGANARILLPGYVALTRALQALGDAAGALGAIQEAMRVWQQYHVTRMWSVPPVATFQARLWLAQGDIASAAQWAQKQGLCADGDLSYQREVDYLTLTRLLIAQGNANEAAGLLERLLEPAETGGRTTRVIEILMLQALALEAQGDTDQAMDVLGHWLQVRQKCKLSNSP